MKTKQRLLFGIISSLLFTCGLARAAERFDPTQTALSTVQPGNHNGTVAPDCLFYPPL